MGMEVLHQLWHHELKILDEIDRICKKNGLQYYLMWGTLIGAVRHQGFIPWDDDIDISMPREDYRRFLKIAAKELSEEFFLQTVKTDKFYPSFFAKVRLKNTAFYAEKDKNVKRHHGIFVDIIPMDRRKEKRNLYQKIKDKAASIFKDHIYKKRMETKKGFSLLDLIPERLIIWACDCLMLGKGDYYCSWGYKFKKSDFFPATELVFMEKKYPAPNNYHSVLTTVYGDYMQLPPEENRIAHVPAFISFDIKKDEEELKKYLESLNV